MSYRRPEEPRQGFSGASNSPRRPKRDNIRFGVNKGRYSRNNLVIDEHIQEATPEHLRIEIDQIIDEFLADPDRSEHVFPPDYNNLQRKYIHYKAQIMNLVSKSQGKEPNRQLHLTKKPKQLASQSFHLSVCDEVYNELERFFKIHGNADLPVAVKTRSVPRWDKVYAKLQDTEPAIPREPMMSREVRGIREKLPIFDKRQHVLDTINSNQVTIICSETGSGKTTQVPQYILEEACDRQKPCKIVCTQPRRISTISAADRVAYERGESVGASVGYHIRLDSKSDLEGYTTSLLFCTVGVFLRNLMCGVHCLKNVTHVIVDEIHERDKLSDFLLICLKQKLPHYPQLKVILMSATMDTTKFQQYFNSSAVMSIPGRLYPITTYFIGDVLSMTGFATPQMRLASKKLQQQKQVVCSATAGTKIDLSKQDQANFNYVLEAYMNFSDDYNYKIHYEESTVDLLQLFISEDVPVDQQHSENGWTALMIACHLGDLEFINKLFTLGASLDVADRLGKTAYDYGRVFNKNNVLDLLDELKQQRAVTQGVSSISDPQYLTKLYDMTTPDEFIDYDLIVELIKYIHFNSDFGSILIFLPGYEEIMRCNDNILESNLPLTSFRIFFLHSSMNMKEQCDVFNRLPDQRKLILSTNIAETSITVEDVVFVIDVGKAKEKVYDSYNKLSALQTQWISRACAKQRQGRAGRVQSGVCFRMYSQQRYNHMPEDRVPEILRVSLEELCLHAKITAPKGMNVYNFLSLAPDPPSINSVGAAIEHLQALGALDKEEDLTKLGEYLSQLSVEPRVGKMLLLACIFKCLEPMLTICAAMAHKDPFQLPPQANLKSLAAAKRRELTEGVASDHSIYLVVFQKWQKEVTNRRSRQFCYDYFISESTMYSVLDTRRQLLGQLRALSFVNNNHNIDDFNYFCHSWGLVKGVMSAAFFPNVAYPIQRGLALSTRSEKKVSIHNTSVCATKRFDHWYFYDEMVKNRISFVVRGATACSPLMVALMCDNDGIYPSSHSVNLDNWLEFYFGDNLVIRFRQIVQSLIYNSFINPQNSFEPQNTIISKTLSVVLNLVERNERLVQPEHVGLRPRFLYKMFCPSTQKSDGPNTRNTRPNRSNRQPNNSSNRLPRPIRGNNQAFNFNEPGSSEPANLAHSFGQLNVNQGSDSPADVLLRALTSTPRQDNPGNVQSEQLFQNQDSYNQRPRYNNYNNSFNMDRGFVPVNGYGHFGPGIQPVYDVQLPPTMGPPILPGFTGQTEDYFTQLSWNWNNFVEPRWEPAAPNPPVNSPWFRGNSQTSDYPDDPIFVLIRAAEKRNIDIAQSSRKWVFSPQTEKKIIYYAMKGKKIYLVYFVNDLQMFMGIAEYQSINMGASFSKPTAFIEWIFVTPLLKYKTRHLINPYNNDRSVYEGSDGTVIKNDVGEELMRIYSEFENSQRF